jgi:hypothetical protein
MKHGLNEAVVRALFLAQVASDSGKGKDSLKRLLPCANQVHREGYPAKDREIRKAISLILQAGKAGKECGFRFEVTYGDNRAPYLVYFDFRIGAERYQVSFHSFDKGLEKFIKTRSYRTRWNRKREEDRKSSRNSVKALKKWVFDM